PAVIPLGRLEDEGRLGRGLRFRLVNTDLLKGSDKAVADARNGLDKFLFGSCLAEDLAEIGNVAGEGGVFDERVGPKARDEFGAPDEVALSLDQDGERVEDLGRYRNDGSVSGQKAFRNIETEAAKTVSC